MLDDFDCTGILPTTTLKFPFIVYHVPKRFVPGNRIYGIIISETQIISCGNQCPPMRSVNPMTSMLEDRSKWLQRLKMWSRRFSVKPLCRRKGWYILFDQTYDTERMPLFKDLLDDGWCFE